VFGVCNILGANTATNASFSGFDERKAKGGMLLAISCCGFWSAARL